MKKAFSTLACMQADYKEIATACKRYGITGVEIRIDDDGGILGKHSPEELRRLKDSFAMDNLTITDLASGLWFRGYNLEQVNEGKRVVQKAECVGAKAIRVFLGGTGHDNEIGKALAELCDIASTSGIEIWAEMHSEYSTGKSMKRIYEIVKRKNLRFIWDVMHSIEYGEALEETWNLLGERIAHVHVKDGIDTLETGFPEFRHTALGEGAIPLNSLLDLLENVNYDGYVSLEWETKWRPELQKYPNTVDFVLKHYADYLKLYENNMVPVIGSKWIPVDPLSKDTTRFIISENRAEAAIDNRIYGAALKKYEITIPIETNTSYRVTVPFTEKETLSRNSVYAIATISFDEAGKARRLYFTENPVGVLALSFQSGCASTLKLELGIKGYGKVVWHRPLLQEISQLENLQRNVTISSVFVSPKPETYDERLQRFEKAIDHVAQSKVDLMAFAETQNTRNVQLELDERFETIDGPYCTLMKRKAREHNCYMFFSYNALDEEGIRRNQAVLVGRDGGVVGIYNKTHLSLTEYEAGIVPGDTYPVFDTDFGRVGMLICWDAYFPEPARAMAMQGAEMLLISTAGDPTHRHISHAKQNGVYVVVSGSNDGICQEGIYNTKIIDPTGEVLSHAGTLIDEHGVIQDRDNVNNKTALARVDLNEKKSMFWLSVGPAYTEPNSVYANEYRDDLWNIILPERKERKR